MSFYLFLFTDFLNFLAGLPRLDPVIYTGELRFFGGFLNFGSNGVQINIVGHQQDGGFLFKGLSHSFLGAAGAIALTSGLWALIHIQYDAYAVATIFCVGLLLGTSRAMTGSVIVPLILHATVNVIATVEAALFG